MTTKRAKIVVIGAGWWSQGWHLRHLSRNDKATILAIVDSSSHPKSNLEPNLESLEQLSARYKCTTYSSFREVPANVRVEMDGVIVCTPHSTHYEIGKQLFEEKNNRHRKTPLHILMEKPITTNVQEARELHELVQSDSSEGCFLLNHTANYRPATKLARDHMGSIGEVRHVSATMLSPLSWLFDDPHNTGWTSTQNGMIGNGFAWGQSSHILAWIYHVLPDIVPQQVYCTMNHSPHSNADISHSATLLCNNNINVSLSGTSLLPGHAHSHPPVGKKISIRIFGTKGCVLFEGDDQDGTSGQLELRRFDDTKTQVLYPEFHFEDTNPNGLGPASSQSFLNACLGQQDYDVGASSEVGLKTVQTIHAMYKSHASGQVELIA